MHIVSDRSEGFPRKKLHTTVSVSELYVWGAPSFHYCITGKSECDMFVWRVATDAGSVSDQTARFVNKSHLLPYLCIATLTRHECFNLSKPNGYVMHQQFNIQQLYFLPTQCIYVFCIYLRTNSDLCHLQHKMFGFCNRDGKCLLCGTNWVFK